MLTLDEWKGRARVEIRRRWGTQKAFVEDTGIGTESGLSQFLNGKYRYSQYMEDIAEALGIDRPDLIRAIKAAKALDESSSSELGSFADLMERAARRACNEK